MSQTSKIVLGIAVLVVVALGVYYYLHVMQKPAQEAQTSGTEGPAEVTTLPSGSNTSDAAINQDLNAIDSQLQGVKSDNADVNTSVSAAAAQ